MSAKVKTLAVSPPENVPLQFEIADVGTRLGAFVLDMVIVLVALIFTRHLTELILWDVLGLTVAWLGAFSTVLMFALRSFYFIWLELRWHGRTIAKRWLKIRVINRSGGPLRADMLFARNLTREIELWLPILVIIAPEYIVGEPAWLGRLIGVALLLAMSFFPLFNAHRARLGDLIAGTVVVVSPKASLLPDLVEAGETGTTLYVFTQAQLDQYGIYELQVLEDVLREKGKDPEIYAIITDKICEKIGYDRSGVTDAEPFLREFYAAQRARLEQRMLFGDRQERKKETFSGFRGSVRSAKKKP